MVMKMGLELDEMDVRETLKNIESLLGKAVNALERLADKLAPKSDHRGAEKLFQEYLTEALKERQADEEDDRSDL